MESERKKLHFFVDSVGEGRAVLLAGDEGEQRLALPLDVLPEGISEGDWLLVSFERDDEKRDCAREEIERLMYDLGDNP